MRLAWFTPLPPIRSGIATYSTELLPHLAERHETDVYVENPAAEQLKAPSPELPAPSPQRLAPSAQILNAHDFVWRHLKHPYDLVVYQLGNATCHDYMWPYLVRYPGLVVLHDAQLHHARARRLLELARPDDYRAEFRFNHPGARPPIVELGIARLLGPLHYLFPMLRLVVVTATAIAVHNTRLAADLAEEFPGARILPLRMGVPDNTPSAERDLRNRIRRQFEIPDEVVVFATLGRVTPEKRIRQVLDALAHAVAIGSDVWALLVGETADYYDVFADARERGLADRIRVTGYVPDSEVAAYLAAADVCMCLRWPTGRETSASWLRCLAAGRATVITDLAHTVDVPALDPRSWSTLRTGAAGEPICVAIDILDEDHSLRLAVPRLASDRALRERLGHSAREYWRGQHQLRHMLEDYQQVLISAAALPSEAGKWADAGVELPRHLRADGTELLRALLDEVGVEVDLLGQG